MNIMNKLLLLMCLVCNAPGEELAAAQKRHEDAPDVLGNILSARDMNALLKYTTQTTEQSRQTSKRLAAFIEQQKK